MTVMEVLSKKLRVMLELARVSNLPTAWTNVIAAWLIAGGDWTVSLLWMLLGASLLYSAGMVLNDAADARWDRDHKKDRPIPSGRISQQAVWCTGLAGMVLGALCCVQAGAQWWWVLALIGAILFYDLYHKPWAGSVVIMGGCRTLLYVMAASAVAVTQVVWLWGIVLGIYVVGLSLAARAEAKGSTSSMQRIVIYSLLLLPVAVSLWLHGGRAFGVVVAFLALVTMALREMRKGGAHIGNAVGWLLAGIPLVDALALVGMHPLVVLAFLPLPLLLKVWQRWVAAT